MKLISEDWEILDRKIHRRWMTTFFMVTLGLLLGPPEPLDFYSSGTWTVRQKSTGVVKRVMAKNESEAADKIAKGWFDAERA
jgi:hypothetical protein